ncbi:serine/threonine-protein kinase [Frankia sp. Cas3]|uniref:WD40 repeat domain-containing serine/threonine protein kinase n=1 Tax=Frankia sp. Cas3 TaxID=3073926 RepID=UPI002AD34B6E|nr:serine/threonine-protein kinase [Frankia sp. Cas3]
MTVDQARVAAALPDYTLGAERARGAFGQVLTGRHRNLNRNDAIKVLAAKHDQDATGFATEARLLAALNHPHIVQVHNYAATDDLHLIVMELLAGGTLTHRQAGMSPEAACAVGLAVAAALSFAHDKDVLHCDIKPDNILFDTAGLLKVTDFGIARLFTGNRPTLMAGTPTYMAPEQVAGGQLSPATDLYALGSVLCQLLTGASPPARRHIDSLPPALAEVIQQALDRDPAHRPQSARTFALALAGAAATAYGPDWITQSGIRLYVDNDIRAAAGQPTPTPDSDVASTSDPKDIPSDTPPDVAPQRDLRGVPGRVLSWLRRRRWRVAAGVLLVALAGTIAAFIFVHPPPHPPPPTTPPASQTPAIPGPLAKPLTGHTGWVSSVAFARHGSTLTLATAGADRTIRLWDVTDPATPRLLGVPLTGPLGGHTDAVTSVAFAPDGNTLASAGWDRTIRLWDVTDPATPRLLGVPLTGPLGGHTGAVFALAFAPDGHTLASAGADRTVRLWDVTDRNAPRPRSEPLKGHTDWVTSVAFARERNILASASYDGTVRLWDVTDPAAPRPLREEPLTSHTGAVFALAFAPNGHTLASAGADGMVRLWDVTDLKDPHQLSEPLTGHTDWVTSVAFAPDGHTVAAGSKDQTIQLWDVTDPSAPRTLGGPLTGHTDWVTSVAFAPDSKTLASGGVDKTVRLWQAR